MGPGPVAVGGFLAVGLLGPVANGVSAALRVREGVRVVSGPGPPGGVTAWRGPHAGTTEGRHVLIAKQEILSLIADRGATERLAEADNDLPDPVDTDLHAHLLTALGLEPRSFGTSVELGGIAAEEPGDDGVIRP